MPHAHHSAREYAAMLEEPSRLEWQQPARLIEALGVRPGMRVADLGTGSGYFLPWLDRAVAPSGLVVAEDIDDALLELVRERTRREGLARVEVRRGQPDDPALEPGRFDLVLLVDTYHHIEDRPGFLAHVRRALVPGRGRFAVVDFRPGELPFGPRPEHKIPPEQVEREVIAAGMPLAAREEFLRYQFVRIFAAPAH